ncbi:hypothetical protein [Halodesulfovibrio sp.]|jgi:hypothetical protein|uniref:hypothetical protein n=1 Tax=Halodesulfovibrio sp. TaxID=1912772 RepID=UPI0025E0B145|nr:hypothetical protein [Halodesulfovibrio sp.]MCT4627505.1 hypothetical protein [Halodesulfovibrio sp.]
MKFVASPFSLTTFARLKPCLIPLTIVDFSARGIILGVGAKRAVPVSAVDLNSKLIAVYFSMSSASVFFSDFTLYVLSISASESTLKSVASSSAF